MKPPFGLYVDRGSNGRVLLRSGNSIDNVGIGPAELHGVRTSASIMRGRQRIYRRGGGRIGVRTGARLFFKFVPGQLRYWKFHHAARFELWSLDADGRRKRLVRRGPKVSYCLRDLRRSHRHLPRSPSRPVYPSCNTSSRIRRVTLGTSVGWSDVYPPSYPENWINVTGLRGCFAYRQVADPLNGIFESNERNNAAQVVVRLPYHRRARSCPGRRRPPSQGEPSPEPY
jgi:lysyl oxidase